MSKIFTIGIVILVFTSCNKMPVACIEAPSTANVGTPVTFRSCSEKNLSQDWFMSGPNGAPENTMGWSDIEFTHTFTVPGSYTVTLNAYSKFSFLGEVNTTTLNLVVQ